MKHKKPAGGVNLLLIVTALVLDFLKLVRPAESFITQVDMILSIVAMIPAIVYIISGYGKSAALYYKMFMCLFAASCLCAVADDVVYTVIDNYGSYFSTVVRVLVFIGALALAFAPDMGKKRTFSLSCIILAVELINSVRLVIKYSDNFGLIVKAVSGVIMACLVCMFVLFKYADKTARGTK